MSRTTYIGVTVAVVAASIMGGALYLGAAEKRQPYPKPTPPPPPSPIYLPSKERAMTAAEIAAEAAFHNERLALEIERALFARDPQERETVFTFLLPELIQLEPRRVVDMVARLEPGEARDTLRNELARQWISRDRDAAVAWMKSLQEGERRASAYAATRTIAAAAPEQAIYVADQFGIGRDDGTLEHLVQIWATANFDRATRWLAAQPAGPLKDQLAARVEHVRRQGGGARDGRD
jgi:hypothetical protein